MRTSNKQPTQNRRGFLGAFAVLAGGAVATVIARGDSAEPVARAPERTAQRSAKISRPATPATPTRARAPEAINVRRVNVAPTAIPSVRM